jgi:predicted dehydrogenase
MPIRIGQIGIAGYGASHLEQVQAEIGRGRAVLAAAVVRPADRHPEDMARLPEGVRLHPDVPAMLSAEQDRLDLVLVPTGIPTHREFAVAAMQAGFNVGVEKPPAGTIEDALDMDRVSRATGRFCAVGFQNTCHPLFRALKRFIADGGIGRVEEIRHTGLWRRLDSYYTRNQWAGKVRVNGAWIFDGPLANPLSHQLNNQLFLASADPLAPARPARVRAEFYRAHDIIEGEDTDSVEAVTTDGVRILFHATLCARVQTEPRIVIRGTGGTIAYTPGREATAVDPVGSTLSIPAVDEGNTGFIASVIDHMTGRGPLYCPVAHTIPYMRVMNGAYESAGTIHPIPAGHIEKRTMEGSVETWIRGIETDLGSVSDRGIIFSQAGLPWARHDTAPFFPLQNYVRFTGSFTTANK